MTARKILSKYVDEIKLVDKIISYIGSNECEKCGVIQDTPLTVVIAWENGNYKLTDVEGSKYKLRKVCNTCTFCRCSQIKIYHEIPNEELMDPLP